MALLHAAITGNPSEAPPLVLLHGFGGGGYAWEAVSASLGDRPLVVYDLPGHGRSIEAEGIGGAGRMAKAIAADLDRRGITSCHVCGHSLGGAVAAILALRQPDRLKSLALLSPGGFGPSINHAALSRYAFPQDREDLRAALREMMADTAEPSDRLIDRIYADRLHADARDALRQVFDGMMRPSMDGGLEQGTLALAEFAGLGLPIHVLWGTGDRILPVPDAAALPAGMTLHLAEGAGHMLVDECPEIVVDLLRGVCG
ncbi:alpha/beta fold hydrolase [Pseudomonas sp. R2.Fl]|nr:alpha/beta fold hydrolase [Pseudomonas sp. R2.Fl]